MAERKGPIQFIKHALSQRKHQMQPNWASTNPDPFLRGVENSMYLDRLSMLRNFDLKDWRQTAQRVNLYVREKENIEIARPGRKCIDGRYEEVDSQGMIARPGGDYGYALTLTAVTDPGSLHRRIHSLPVLVPEECFDMVFSTVTAEGDQFYMHTDHHDDGRHIGCGHAAAPTELNEAYRIFDEARASRLLARARQQRDGMHVERLEGKHSEQAVLYVLGKRKTIRSQNKGMQEMYFVYDLTRDYEYMVETLMPALTDRLGLTDAQRGIFFDSFLDISSVQAGSSLNLLADPKPLLTVNVDGFRANVGLLEPGTKIDLRAKLYGESMTGLIPGLPPLP